MMCDNLQQYHLNYVNNHYNQTRLVDKLLARQIFHYEEIEGLYVEGEDEPQDVYQWLVFPNFYRMDYFKLIKANVPVLDSEIGTWVGITSFGSHYSLYVYPELIKALFGISCDYNEIEKVSKLLF